MSGSAVNFILVSLGTFVAGMSTCQHSTSYNKGDTMWKRGELQRRHSYMHKISFCESCSHTCSSLNEK